MAERALREIRDGEVEVGAGRDDDGVLAAGLGQQWQVGTPGAEQLGGVPPPGEDEAVDAGVGDERLAEGALVDGDETQHITWHAGLPERLDHHGGASTAEMGRLDDDAAAGRECCQHTAGRYGDGEVPRWRDQREDGRLEARSVDDVEA